MTAKLSDMIMFLDRELRTAEIPDYAGAINGLQLANDGAVPRVIAAVDASLAVVEEAARGGPALLVVHHGMFWQGAQPLTGATYRKIKAAMQAGLAIYSSHIPLDIHPAWGNNVIMAQRIGLADPQPFFPWKGIQLGIRGRWEGSREELAASIRSAVGSPAHLCPGGPENPRQIGIITGGAGSEIAKVAAEEIDTFITGEGPHWSYLLAEESGMNVFYAGHYATETFGVKALAAVLSARFAVPWNFLDRPTGL